MWAAVLMQAIEDATRTNVREETSACASRDRDEARRLLFSTHGPWAEARRQLCFMAGIDPDAFAERVASGGDHDRAF